MIAGRLRLHRVYRLTINTTASNTPAGATGLPIHGDALGRVANQYSMFISRRNLARPAR
jgi:hypothetical protein